MSVNILYRSLLILAVKANAIYLAINKWKERKTTLKILLLIPICNNQDGNQNNLKMLELNFDPFPVLTTERLILRQTIAADANEMFFLRSDEEVMKYIDRPRAKSVQDAVTFIETLSGWIKNNETIIWAITLKNDPTLIGNAGFWHMQKENYRAELGYVLHPSHQGKGIMSEAVNAILDHGFKTMKLHSVEANINPENAASAKVLEKAGFVREAYFKENFFFNGKFLDSVIYSLLAREK